MFKRLVETETMTADGDHDFGVIRISTKSPDGAVKRKQYVRQIGRRAWGEGVVDESSFNEMYAFLERTGDLVREMEGESNEVG